MTEERFFIVPGEPTGKGRPRFMRSGHAYTPSKTAAYESLVRASYSLRCKGEPVEKGVPLVATIECIFSIPKSASKKRKQAMLCGLELPCKVPDTDNLAKAVLDALNGIAYHDDSQITTLHVIKRYGLDPCVKVWISKEDV
jgi:Holliday junction resolvase RusA-like endonuclease